MNAANIKIVRRVNSATGEMESFDSLLRRFKRAYQDSGVLAGVRKHEFAMSKSQKRREKRKLAEKQRLKDQRKLEKYVITLNLDK